MHPLTGVLFDQLVCRHADITIAYYEHMLAALLRVSKHTDTSDRGPATTEQRDLVRRRGLISTR
jgi:hypothetical protein